MPFREATFVRYVFATIDWYAPPMMHSQSGPAGSHGIDTAFIFRLIWDGIAQQWRILVKPTAGGDARLFGDIEAAFAHVEKLMAERVLRLDLHAMDEETGR